MPSASVSSPAAVNPGFAPHHRERVADVFEQRLHRQETILIPWLAADSQSSSRSSASRSSSRSSASRCSMSSSAANRRCRPTRRWCCASAASSAKLAPADVVGYLRGVEDADGALDRRQPAQGQGRSARQGGAAEADRLRVAVLGQGAGNPRRGARLQEVGQAGLRLPRIRRRPRVLPGDRGRQGVPDAVDAARSRSASPPTSCSCAARSTRSARIPTCTTSATTRPRSNTFTEKGYTAGAQGDGRVAQPRSVRPDRARHRRRPEEERSRRPHADRRRAVPAGGRAAAPG